MDVSKTYESAERYFEKKKFKTAYNKMKKAFVETEKQKNGRIRYLVKCKDGYREKCFLLERENTDLKVEVSQLKKTLNKIKKRSSKNYGI